MSKLVLTRKRFEHVNIYDRSGNLVARVAPVQFGHGKVKLSFQCPPEFNVVREEIDETRHPLAPSPTSFVA